MRSNGLEPSRGNLPTALNLVHAHKMLQERPNRPIARFRGRIGRIWKSECCHDVATGWPHFEATVSIRLRRWRQAGIQGRYCVHVAPSIDFTIAFDEPDEAGWIVARVLEVPGALSQGRTREEARENVLDALRTVLTPDDELSGRPSGEDLEHLRFIAAV